MKYSTANLYLIKEGLYELLKHSNFDKDNLVRFLNEVIIDIRLRELADEEGYSE